MCVGLLRNLFNKMNSQPLYREVRLSLAADQDLKLALDIIRGKATVSEVADSLRQEHWSFDGEGDILCLSYTRGAENDAEAAAKALGDRGDQIVKRLLAPAVFESTVALELVLRYCNLSTAAVVDLALALQENSSFVGFNVRGNPGNNETGNNALKRACVETMAPITWFQGRVIDSALAEARHELAKGRMRTMLQNSALSPKTKVAELRRMQKSAVTETDKGSEDLNLLPRKATKQDESASNERLKWRSEMAEKLKSVHNYSDSDIDVILSNLEMLQLQETIDKMLIEEAPTSSSSLESKRSSGRAVPTQYLAPLLS